MSVASRPLGDDLLFGELEDLRARGVDTLISLLHDDELLLTGLWNEELAAPIAGLLFERVPTPDQTHPPADDLTLRLLARLGDTVRRGRHVACHCYAGHGRSPAFAAAILVTLGYRADEAMAAVTLARRKQVPHRSSQQMWVRWVEQELAAG